MRIVLLLLLLLMPSIATATKTITVAVVNAPPLVYETRLGWQGIIPDILAETQKQLAEEYVFVYKQFFTIKDAVSSLKSAETAMLFTVTPKDTEDFLVTKPFLKSNVVFIKSYRNSSNSIKDKTIAVVKGSAIETYLQTKEPNLKLIPMASDLECIMSVALNQIDITAMDMSKATWYIQTMQLSSLTIMDKLGFTCDVSFAMHQKYEKDFEAINKAYNKIDLTIIHKKHLGLYEPSLFENSNIGYILALVSSSMLIYIIYNCRRSSRLKSDLIVTLEHTNKLAHHDHLTGLLNRRALMENLEILTKQEAGFSVIFMDLDRFKAINDNYGHTVGDEILVLCSERLMSAVRFDENLYRIGGDEFVVLLKGDLDHTIVTDVASRVLNAMKRPFKTKNKKSFKLSVSMGISIYPLDTKNAQELLQYADVAMYRAKDLGRDGFAFFDHKYLEACVEIHAIEQGLQGIVTRDELSLVFQPQIDLATMKVIGAEALLRWSNFNLGNIPPSQFIPIAEDTDAIIPIGEWVLTQACKFISKFNMRVSVNVSAVQLSRYNLVDYIKQLIIITGVDPTKLELELTESIFLKDSPETLKTLTSLGIGIAIDDFGTGYSSLGYLKNYSGIVTRVKLDRSFIEDIHKPSYNLAMIKSIIDVVKSLEALVIAEGVETKLQLDKLLDLGCDEIQGYYISKPLPMEAFKKFLRDYNAQSMPQARV